MARLINGINGPFIGKAGSVIGYTMNGVAYMKGLPKKRTKPFTERELLNQKKFAAAQRWLRPLLEFVKPGFKGFNERFQGFSAAKSWLMKKAMFVVNGEVIIDPSLVKISSGSLSLPEDIAISFEAPNLFRFTWKPCSPQVSEPEQAMVLVYSPDENIGSGCVYGNYRSRGEHVVPVALLNKNMTFHCYIAFLSTDRSNQSDSVYLGSFTFDGSSGNLLKASQNKGTGKYRSSLDFH
jgi:hypothetical protein